MAHRNNIEYFRKCIEKHRDWLMATPGVVGVAEGMCNGKPCIKLFVLRKNQPEIRALPTTLDGYAISIEVTGEFKALA
jgi:hypothetical protein